MDGENKGVEQFRLALDAYIDLMREYHELSESKATSCVVDVLETREATHGESGVDWAEVESP